MIGSMTGFGKGVADGEVGRVIVEVQSLNGKYGDVVVHLPYSLPELESRIKARVLSVFSRGRINVIVTLQSNVPEQGLPVLKTEVLAAYLKGIEDIRAQAELAGEVDVMQVAQLPQTFVFEVPEINVAALWAAVADALAQALCACRTMRLAEGEKLVQDWQAHVHEISFVFVCRYS